MFGRYRFQLQQQDHPTNKVQNTVETSGLLGYCYVEMLQINLQKPLRLKTITLFLHDTLKAEKGVSFYPNLSNTGFVLLMHIKLTTPPHINTVK